MTATMAEFEVSFQTETNPIDSTFPPLSTVSAAPGIRNLLAEKPVTTIVYLILLFIVSLWGGTTNFLILIVHMKNKKLNKAGRIFLVNLALADMCVNFVAIPFCIIGVTHGEKYFKEHPYLCRFIGSFCFSVCICAILNLLMATINRYVYVCHNHIYVRFFNSRFSLGSAIFIWILAILIDSSNILGWGGYTFDKKNHSCIWDRMADFTFTMFVSVVLIVFPLTTVAFLNFFLLRKIHATKFNICMMRDVAGSRTKRNAWIETMRASRTLVTMCVMFLICWLPYAAIVAFDTNDTYSEETHLFITLLAHSHSAMNFILYWLCNKEFSTTVYRVWGFVFSCQTASSTSSASFSTTPLELSSISSISGETHSEKKRWYSCCQCRRMLQHNSSERSTSTEIIDTDKEGASNSSNIVDCAPDAIYTLPNSVNSSLHATGFGRETTNFDQNMNRRGQTVSRTNFDFIPFRGESRETQTTAQGTGSGILNKSMIRLHKRAAKYRISK